MYYNPYAMETIYSHLFRGNFEPEYVFLPVTRTPCCWDDKMKNNLYEMDSNLSRRL
jgi:hypothetical protein